MPDTLFDAFPALSPYLPQVSLAMLPTPVQALPDLPHAWIKRDDLTRSDYGGNKIRKLEFVLGEIRAKGARHVITFGATGTNAGVATALMCQRERLRCSILLFPQPDSPTVRKNYQRMQAAGAQLIQLPSLFNTALAFYLHPRRLDPHSYFLYAGCSNAAGIFSYISAAFELRAQIARGECPEPLAIVLPVGSGGTLSGLTLGCALAGLHSRVIGVRVAPSHVGPFDACTPKTLRQQMRHAASTLQKAGITLPILPEPVLLDDYYGPGYGSATPEALNAIRWLQQHSNIPLEQTYSGKAFACFLDKVQQQAGPVLFWNTYSSADSERE